MDPMFFFGFPIREVFDDWFDKVFTPSFHKRFGDDKGMTLVLLDPDQTLSAILNWDDPLRHRMIVKYIRETDAIQPGGTLYNVAGKLRFSLRTACNSVMAESANGLRRPLDFPWEGAGFVVIGDDRPEFIGGVSGLAKEDDWAVLVECATMLADLMIIVDAVAYWKYQKVTQIKPVPVDLKYMENLHVTQSDVNQYMAEVKVYLNLDDSFDAESNDT